MQSHSDETTVYRVEITDRVEPRAGMGTVTLVGQLVDLGGVTYVKCGTTLHAAEGWYTIRSDAELDAAEAIEARAAALAAQAERIRAAAGEVH